MKVLASIEWFSPAYRAGGIISSLKNQIEHLHGNLDFWVVTGNADLTSPAPVSDEIDQWINRENHHVLYSSQTPDWNQISADVNPDLIYINGLFNGPFNRRLLTWCKGKNYPVRLASHGMLAPNALRIKPLRKRLWLKLEDIRNTFQNLEWHATSEIEKEQILAWFPQAFVHIAQNLPPFLSTDPTGPHGDLNFLSVGRVHRIKNYAFAALCLSKLAKKTGRHITYRIIGPIEDEAEQQKILDCGHALMTCELLGERGPDDLPEQFQNTHALLAPSLTENYGQVIAEALAQGVPVLVSDQTPWVGFPPSPALHCLPLEPVDWVTQLEPLMDREKRMALIQPAQDYFTQHLLKASILEAHLRMFQP